MNWSVEASPLGPTIEPTDAVEEAMADFQQGNHGEVSAHAHAWALENAELMHNMQLLFGCMYKLTCQPAGPDCSATTMKSVASDLVECLERIEKHEAAEPHWRTRGTHEAGI